MLRVACEAKSEEAEYCGDSEEPRCHRPPKVVRGVRYRLQPTAVLSKLSRVCRTFQATIQGSPKLQRALTGVWDASLDTLVVPPSLPMKWLCQHALGLKEVKGKSRYFIHIDHWMMKMVRDKLRWFLDRDRKRRWEASWRQVKIQHHPEADHFPVPIVFRRPNGYKGKRDYMEKLDLSDCSTLGDLLDELPAIVNRRGAEHVKRLNSLARVSSSRRWM